MYRYRLMISCMLLAVLAACHKESVPAPEKGDFSLGADIGWLTEMENDGAVFYDREGNPKDCIRVLKEYGLTAVRLRVWVDPSAHGNWCNAGDVLKKALRAKKEGMEVMIDFHYSDWWADPGKQNIPAAWAGHDFNRLKEDVKAHTVEVLGLLKENGVFPRWVQIGNETSDGFLWPVGKASIHPDRYAGLFKAGYDAAKSVFPDASVLVHLDSGHLAGHFLWNLNILQQGGAEWDMIGMSVYPYWAQQSDPSLDADQVLDDCLSTMDILSEKYGCDIMVVETGMQCAENGRLADEETLQESRRQLEYLIGACSRHPRCRGVFYWEPECRPSRYPLGAFSESGHPAPIMDAFLKNVYL